jgi:hypothetical protein
VFETHCLYYLYWNTSIDEFDKRVKGALNGSGWGRREIVLSKLDYPLIEKIIDFKNKYKNTDVIFRHEGDKMSLFSNDLAIISEAISLDPTMEVTQVTLAPAGVKYFKKNPPARYRMYLGSKRIENTEDLIEFLERTPDIRPNSVMERGMVGMTKYRYRYISSDFFFDYDEDTTATLFGLMFPELIGKVYKLEKKEG